MIEVGAYEAKTHFSGLLEKVKSGESVLITKHHHPVARLVPAEKSVTKTVNETIKALKAFRTGKRLGKNETIKSLIAEGRK